MKKLLLIPIITLLFACGGNNATLKTNEPLTYDVKIKDSAEFILVKEGTSVDEFTNNLESYLDIDTNADSYTIEWVGEAYSSLDAGEYSEKKTMYPFETSRENTLNHDSFRPIGLYVTFKKDGVSKIDYKQVILAVAREDEYNAILSSNSKKIENAYIAIAEQCGYNDNGGSYDISVEKDQYIPNIRQRLG